MKCTITRHIATAALAGLVIGTVVGGIEGLANFQATKAQNPSPLIVLLTTAIHVIYFAGAGLVVGLLCGILARTKKEAAEPRPIFSRYLVFFVFVFGALFAFGTLYGAYGEDLYGLRGVLLGAGALAALVVVGFVLSRLLRKVAVRGRAFGLGVTGLWALFVVVLIVIGLKPTAASGSGAIPKPPTSDRPNILFVLVDALRADHLGCYGYERDTSPSVDALAADGVLFERCYAQSSWTRPSIASMLTSTVPPLHRTTEVFSVIPPEFKKLPDNMSEFGYLTSSFSASALISRTFGFAMNVDAYKASTRTLSIETGLFKSKLGIAHEQIGGEGRLGWIGDNIYRLYNKIYRNLVWVCAQMRDEFRIMKGDAASVNETFLRWLDGIEGARFTTYLHYLEPHAPYDPDPPFDTMFDTGYQGEPVVQHPKKFPLTDKVLFDFPSYDEDALEDMIAHYDGEIAQCSHEFGKLMDELKKRGIYDDTFIIYISDHGDEFYDHKSWGHGHSVFNELIQVPMIFKFPRSEYAGKRVPQPVTAIDILPTIFDLLGVEPWGQAEGKSLMPLIRGEVPEWQANWDAISITGREDSMVRSYIDDGYKVIHAVRGEESRWSLYDIANDPGETRDISKEKPELFKKMREKLEKSYADYDHLKNKEMDKADIPPELLEKLRALGYIK